MHYQKHRRPFPIFPLILFCAIAAAIPALAFAWTYQGSGPATGPDRHVARSARPG